jgi:transcriptional regulator with XRE-family HTH domain
MTATPTPWALALGAAIASAREQAGITQSELGRRMGARPEHVSRWERGVIPASLETLEKVARAIAAPVEATLPTGSSVTVKPSTA